MMWENSEWSPLGPSGATINIEQGFPNEAAAHAHVKHRRTIEESEAALRASGHGLV
jgi:hypothetical protein